MKCAWKLCNKEFLFEKKKGNPQRFCSKRYSNRFRVTKRRRTLKQMAVAYKGGKCERCGYNKCVQALQFHHKDPSKKSFGLSVRGLTRSWEKIKEEIEKCLLLCANCHSEIHADEHE